MRKSFEALTCASRRSILAFMLSGPAGFLLKFPEVGQLETIMERTTVGGEPVPSTVVTKDALNEMAALVRDMKIENKTILKYCARLVRATHAEDKTATDMVRKYMRYGASPRAAQALIWGGKVRALMAGKPCIDFDDIRAVCPLCLRHRIILNFEGESANIATDAIITEVIAKVPEVNF